MDKTATWLAWAAGLWAFPAGIVFLGISFGRAYPWPELAVDVLFALNCLAVLLFVGRSGKFTEATGRGVYLAVGIPLAAAELVVSGCLWYLRGLVP